MYKVNFRSILIPLFLLAILFLAFKISPNTISKKPSVLVFSITKGFRHASIPDGIKAIRKMGDENNFTVDASEDVAVFTPENLKKYKVLVFLSPTGTNVFNDSQKRALKEYINNGGRFVGIHAATDFCYEWEWYGKMVGAYFESHPKIQKVKLDIIMPKNKMVRGLPQPWMHKDEWYNFKTFNPAVKVLIKADETSYEGGNMNNDHPVSWYHEFEGGKVFYTALGHTKECYSDPLFLKHLWAGMNWVMN